MLFLFQYFFVSCLYTCFLVYFQISEILKYLHSLSLAFHILSSFSPIVSVIPLPLTVGWIWYRCVSNSAQGISNLNDITCESEVKAGSTLFYTVSITAFSPASNPVMFLFSVSWQKCSCNNVFHFETETEWKVRQIIGQIRYRMCLSDG